jgi:DNA-binding HxlR family transcriptional regulator
MQLVLAGATKKMIEQRLKELEAQGLVTREVICERAIAVAYEITCFNRTALDILEKIKDWTEENGL